MPEIDGETKVIIVLCPAGGAPLSHRDGRY